MQDPRKCEEDGCDAFSGDKPICQGNIFSRFVGKECCRVRGSGSFVRLVLCFL